MGVPAANLNRVTTETLRNAISDAELSARGQASENRDAALGNLNMDNVYISPITGRVNVSAFGIRAKIAEFFGQARGEIALHAALAQSGIQEKVIDLAMTKIGAARVTFLNAQQRTATKTIGQAVSQAVSELEQRNAEIEEGIEQLGAQVEKIQNQINSWSANYKQELNIWNAKLEHAERRLETEKKKMEQNKLNFNYNADLSSFQNDVEEIKKNIHRHHVSHYSGNNTIDALEKQIKKINQEIGVLRSLPRFERNPGGEAV